MNVRSGRRANRCTHPHRTCREQAAVTVKDHKIPLDEAASASLYKLTRLWMDDGTQTINQAFDIVRTVALCVRSVLCLCVPYHDLVRPPTCRHHHLPTAV
jgi:hypothetical protein